MEGGPGNKCVECCRAEDIDRSFRSRNSRVSSAKESAGNDRSKASRVDLEGPNDFNENPYTTVVVPSEKETCDTSPL